MSNYVTNTWVGQDGREWREYRFQDSYGCWRTMLQYRTVDGSWMGY